MNKLPSIRIRFHFTFSSDEVAFERLHREMAEIATAFNDDKNAAAVEHRKHIQRIFLVYSNGGFTQPVIACGYRAPEQGQQIAKQSDTPALAVAEPPFERSVDTSINKQLVQAKSVPDKQFDPNDDFGVFDKCRREGGAFKFGDLEID